MATSPNNKQANKQAVQAAAPAEVKKSAPKVSAPRKQYTLLFDKQNYLYMIGGIALIFIGFILMSGGKSANPHEFHYDEIYSFQRITLAPIVILLGFGLEVYAIMKKPKQPVSAESNS